MIGVDFDNTIVCYDEVFRRIAVEEGMVPAGIGTSKGAVRDHLRSIGREDDWTALQGLVYGARIDDAPAFPGVLDFFRACVEAKVPVCIVSHKTQHPFLGPPYDLHAAARGWLERQGFFDAQRIGLSRSQVFFELTKADKLARIGAAGCTLFIDDLPEFLAEPAFPTGVERVLFDPNLRHTGDTGFRRAECWSTLTGELLGSQVTA